jgi:diaminopimelate epimerase
MRFTKMQGAGNDYVYVNCFDEPTPKDPAELARRVSDRHFGIGGDGLILICPSDVADARMRMCRNTTLQIETGRGVLSLELEIADEKVCRVRVDMGEPILEPASIPTRLPGNPASGGAVANVVLSVAEDSFLVTCVSMGNPHCVMFVEELEDDFISTFGPLVEVNRNFPKRVNAEFVKVLSPNEVRMRVWERGTGETLACGTGACAVCVAGVLAGRTERNVLVHLPGGDLELEWAENNHVYMTGEAVEVYSGEWDGNC